MIKKHLFQFAGVRRFRRDGFGAGSSLRYTTGPGESSSHTPNVWSSKDDGGLKPESCAETAGRDDLRGCEAEGPPIRQEMRQNREALAAAVKANNTAQIERLSVQQGNLIGKTLAIKTQARAKFYATLTPEQRMKADQMFEQMRSRMRRGMTEER